MDPDADRKRWEPFFDPGNIEILQGFLYLQGGPYGARFLIRVGKGSSPNRDGRFTYEFIQHSLVLEDDLIDHTEILVKGVHQDLRGHILAQGIEALQVGLKQGAFPFFALKGE